MPSWQEWLFPMRLIRRRSSRARCHWTLPLPSAAVRPVVFLSICLFTFVPAWCEGCLREGGSYSRRGGTHGYDRWTRARVGDHQRDGHWGDSPSRIRRTRSCSCSIAASRHLRIFRSVLLGCGGRNRLLLRCLLCLLLCGCLGRMIPLSLATVRPVVCFAIRLSATVPRIR